MSEHDICGCPAAFGYHRRMDECPAPTDTTDDEGGRVVLGQFGEHDEPGPCSACGKSASACGRGREYCCPTCSTSRFETHHTTADEKGAGR